MIDSKLRKFYDALLVEPLLNTRCLNQVDPRAITFAAGVCGILGAILIPFLPYAAVAALIFSGFLDTLDGAVARKRNLSSPKGAVLDIISDRAVEFAIILGLYEADPVNRGVLSLLMLGSVLLCVTSFLVVGIFSPNESPKGFHYSSGLMERTEAFLLFTGMILWPAAFTWLSIIFSGLVFFTALQRVRQFVR
jgi:phosphatidylglycerophosphate synthase